MLRRRRRLSRHRKLEPFRVAAQEMRDIKYGMWWWMGPRAKKYFVRRHGEIMETANWEALRPISLIGTWDDLSAMMRNPNPTRLDLPIGPRPKFETTTIQRMKKV